jgi:hypothetical protein
MAQNKAAKIEDETVTQVIVGDWQWAIDRLGGDWVDATGKQAGIGYSYADGEFRPPQPYPSWIWVDGAWTAPVPYPDEPGDWCWDEDAVDWVACPE